MAKPLSLERSEVLVGIAGVPVSCEYGKERLGRVVMLFTEVVAARFVMKEERPRASVQ